MDDIKFYDMPAVILKPGTYVEQNFRNALRNVLAEFNQEVMLISQRLSAHIEPTRWQGGTLDDCTSGGTYTGSVKTDILVEIDGTGTPDTFRWSKDGGATWEVETVDIVAGPQTLENGIQVTFGATTGHAVGDSWIFGAWAEPSVAEKVPTTLYSVADVASYFGYGSNMHMMAKAAIAANKYLSLYGCALDDHGSGVQAVGGVTLAGTVTVPGALRVWIDNKPFDIALTVGDTAAVLAIDLQNEIAKYLDQISVDPEINDSTPGKVDLTAKNAGTIGNQTKLAYEITGAAGITVAITDMASGATDPDPDDATDVCASGSYNIYVCPWNDSTNLGKFTVHVDEVSGPLEKRFAKVVAAYSGTPALGIALAQSLNHHRLTIGHLEATKSPVYELSAAYAAILAGKNKSNQSLNDKDLLGISTPALADRATRTEEESMLAGGLTPFKVGTNGRVQIVRAVTTYTKNAQAADDTSRREVSTIDTMDYVSTDVISFVSTLYANANIEANTTNSIKSDMYSRLKMHENAGILKNVDVHKDLILAQVSGSDINRINVQIPLDVVNNLHVIAIRTDLLLS